MSRPFRKSAVANARRLSTHEAEDVNGDEESGTRRPRISRTVLPPELSGCCGVLDRWRLVREKYSVELAAYLMVNRR
jgi:hypothetical protein